MTTDPRTVIHLAQGFQSATSEAWRALAEKGLKGAAVDSLATIAEGVTIQPLYARDDRFEPLAVPPRRSVDRARPWDLRAPVTSSAAALEALAGGAASLLVDTDASGVGAPDDLARLLDGVLTDVAPVALDAGAQGEAAARCLSRAVKASPNAPLAFHLDPIGAGVGAIDSWAGTAVELAALHPRASLFLASGSVIHEAGGAPSWELAFAIACALDYARALKAAGLGMETAFGGIVLGLSVDNRPLAAIAKLRAARVLWDRIARACRVVRPAIIEARSSRRMLTVTDVWSNLVRVTQAGFAAAVGGADAIVLYPHDAATGATGERSPRLARNVNLILMEEAHIGKVDDPVAGAWAFEALTEDLARAAWAAFTAIEREGGAAAAMRSGFVAREVGASLATLEADLAARRRRIIGVTDFRAEPAAEASQPAKRGGLRPVRLEMLAS